MDLLNGKFVEITLQIKCVNIVGRKTYTDHEILTYKSVLEMWLSVVISSQNQNRDFKMIRKGVIAVSLRKLG